VTCAAKQSEWTERQKAVDAELAAIDKAVEILQGGVKAFIQTGGPDARTDADNYTRQRVNEIVAKLAKSSTDSRFALQQITSAVAEGPFDKVKDMIENMIARLLDEAAGEADSKTFCDTEVTKSRAKQGDLSQKLDRQAARIEKAAAAKALLGQQVNELQSEIAESDGGQLEATKIRSAEKAAYERNMAEWKESAAAIANAMEVLETYYANGAFVQSNQAPEFGGKSGDIASTILGLLEVAESDYTKLISEGEASERNSDRTHKELTQENAVTKAAKSAEADGKRSEIKSLEVNSLNYKQDHMYISKELDAVMSYMDKLKPQCETKVMTFGERKARREQEIAGLKEALEILGAQ